MKMIQVDSSVQCLVFKVNSSVPSLCYVYYINKLQTTSNNLTTTKIILSLLALDILPDNK